MRKLLLALFLSLSMFTVWSEGVAHAGTVYFNLYVRHENYSISTQRVRKDDWDPAVANILGGLGWGRKVNLRAWTSAEGEPATAMVVAGSNGRYSLYYLPGYGTVGRYYYLNASKHGILDSTIYGRFAP
ncbi:hypothetical protein [Abiotrophia defectiva]|uniref:hypothetical protein n=1 Tax=Abiotrophia defectiva TaxID=46125 RepID=UPI003C75B396